MRTADLVPLIPTDEGTFTFEHQGIGIHYPAVSECGRFPVSPDYYGFETISTGGGCTAWSRDFTVNGERVHMLITPAVDGGTHVISPFEPLTIGVYADSGDWWVAWDQEFGTPTPKNITKEGI